MTKSTLTIIVSNNPESMYLITNIKKIQEIILAKNKNNKICVIDSDSDDFTVYNIIKKYYPFVEVHFTKNKNYEYGAYKYAYNKYPYFDIYVCIQDTFILEKDLNIDLVSDNQCYINYRSCIYKDWYENRMKKGIITLLNNCNLDYKDLIDTQYNLATHNSFIVNNFIMKNIFTNLKNAPVNKYQSICYERLFGLYFTIKKINTIDLRPYFIKKHGSRQ